MTSFKVTFDVLSQGEGVFEKTAVAYFTLDEEVGGFLDPQDAQEMLEVVYSEKIIQPTSIERVVTMVADCFKK